MKTLILGIGNLLMGDEGVGIHVIRYLQENHKLPGTDIVDGGTGGFHLMEYFHEYERVILVDATIDGKPIGTINMLQPKYSKDYPQTLTAHDIGLKDLIDALYLLERKPNITLFTISISQLDKMDVELSPELREVIPKAAEVIEDYLNSIK